MKKTPIFNYIAAIAGPMVIVLIRFVGLGAESASAQQGTSQDAMAPADVIEFIHSDPALHQAWIASKESFTGDSKWNPVSLEDNPDPQNETRPGPTISFVENPSFVLSAIFSKGDREAAVLDNKIYWIGSDLGYGWTLKKVDTDRRTVTLTHKSGKSHTIEFDVDR